MIKACKKIIEEYEKENPDLMFVENPQAFRLYWSAKDYFENNE